MKCRANFHSTVEIVRLMNLWLETLPGFQRASTFELLPIVWTVENSRSPVRISVVRLTERKNLN